ncbi:hypothetical protein Micbo1qcDRAFT_158039, partial [Microdochium bolleyi]
MSALQKVIATPELLEAVLLHLDLRTLLVHTQLVSRYFRHLIVSSVALQKALFLLPDGGSRGEPHTSDRGPPVLNPLLREPFWLWYPPADDCDPMRTTTHRINAGFVGPRDLRDDSTTAPHHGITRFHRLAIWADQKSRAAIMRPEASWRRMFVQQPVPRSLGWLSWGLDFSPAEAAVVPIVMRGVVPFPEGL